MHLNSNVYRSPWIYRYNSGDGKRDTNWKMYDWSGPEVSLADHSESVTRLTHNLGPQLQWQLS